MHEDGCINAYDIFVHLHHGLPPVFLDIILQQTAIRTVIIDGTQSVIDLTAGVYVAILLGMADHF